MVACRHPARAGRFLPFFRKKNGKFKLSSVQDSLFYQLTYCFNFRYIVIDKWGKIAICWLHAIFGFENILCKLIYAIILNCSFKTDIC